MSRKTPPAAAEQAHAFVISRAWLVTLVVLALIPWFAFGALYFAGGRAPLPVEVPGESQPAVESSAGRWGKLLTTPIAISPPLELIADNWGRPEDAGKYWFFPETQMGSAQSFLASTGLTAAQVSLLMSSARPEPRINGLVMLPSADLLREMPSDVRANLYMQLAGTPLNANISSAFRYPGTSPDEWFGDALTPATRQLIDPLIYRHGGHMYLADIDLIRSMIPDPEERRRLAKAALRQPTVRVRLEVANASEIPTLVEYWGRGGRRTDIKPLIESVAGAGPDHSIDIVHLLPSLAREHLYRYPRRSALDLDRPALANCLWTALNFFEAEPDDRLLDIQTAVKRLKEDYYLVENSPELGDILVLVDQKGNIIHAVNYLADELVFTKNGLSPMAPWVILPQEMVLDYYRSRSENPHLFIHRRKEF